MKFLYGVALVAPALLLAACGPSSPTPSSGTQSAAPATSSATAAPSDSSAPSASGTASPGAYVLTTDRLPTSSQTWSQIADGLLGSNAASHQRGWQNPDNSQRIEVDVLVESSSSAAASDWPRWRDQLKSKITGATESQCPSSISGSSCVEAVGTNSTKSEGVIAWQNDKVLSAAFLVNTTGSLDQKYLEDIARVQDTWITNTQLGL